MDENLNAVIHDIKKDSDKLELYDWVQCIVAALVIGILCFMFIGRVIGVIGTSMVPTLQDDDQLIVSKLFYSPKQGDIVVFQTDVFGDEPLVKRIIATEDQIIDINFTSGVVYVDGNALKENYTAAPTTTRENFEGPVTVPKGCIFVMGDNRNASTDSRSSHVGMVDTRSILGKVYFIIIPGRDIANGERDWSRIGRVE